jgi:hypothetical protein
MLHCVTRDGNSLARIDAPVANDRLLLTTRPHVLVLASENLSVVYFQ